MEPAETVVGAELTTTQVLIIGGGPGGEDCARDLAEHGIKVGNGTIIKSLTGGGGGYGLAVERDPEAVRQDVIDALRRLAEIDKAKCPAPISSPIKVNMMKFRLSIRRITDRDLPWGRCREGSICISLTL